MTSRRPGSVGRDSAALFIGNAIVRGAALLAIVIMTRLLEQSAVAGVIYAQTIVAYLAAAQEFGWTTTGISVIARDSTTTRPVMGAVLIARLSTGALGVVLVGAIIVIVPIAQPLSTLLVLYALAAFMGAADVTWVGQALRSATPRAVVAGAGGLLWLAVMFPLLLATHRPEAVPASLLLATTIVAAPAVAFVMRHYGHPTKPSVELFASLWRFTLPLGLSSLLALVYYNFDLILIGLVRSVEEVAIYGAVYKIILGLQMVSLTFSSASLAGYSAAHVAGDGTFERLLRFNLRLLGSFALPVAVGGTILASSIVVAVFGPAYASGAVPFALLLWAVLFAFLHSTMVAALSAIGRGWVVTQAIVVGVIINVTANVILISRFGMPAAAAVTAATEIVVLVLVASRLQGARAGLLETLRFLPPALVMAVCLIGLHVIAPDLPVIIVVTVGASIDLLACVVLRAWPDEDRRRIAAAIRPWRSRWVRHAQER